MAKARQNLTKRINSLKTTEAHVKKALAKADDETRDSIAMRLSTVQGTKAGLRLRAREERKGARKAKNARKRTLRKRAKA